MKVFLSWSRPRSYKVTKYLHGWLLTVTTAISPIPYSPIDFQGDLFRCGKQNGGTRLELLQSVKLKKIVRMLQGGEVTA